MIDPAPRRGWLLLGVLGAGVLGAPVLGCDPVDAPTDDDTDPPTVLEQVLAQVGPGVVLPAVDAFRTDAVALRDAVDAWEAAIAAGEGADEARAAVQAAWRDAMASWQALEVMQLGPAGSSIDVPGGRDLRDVVYAWPTVNRCRVDQETVAGAWEDAAFFDAARVDVQGLAALEALLFGGAENGCPPHTEPNASGAWAALGEDGVAERRAGYALVLAERVLVHADALRVAWSPDGDDFSGLLASSGSTGSPYTSDGHALDAVFDALFYLELSTKDRKLANPLGLRDCPTGDCAANAETRLSGTSHLWVAANLRGFRALFTGGDGAGLDDLLVDRGEDALVAELLDRLDAADAAAAALKAPVDVQIGADPAPVQALHDAVKGVTDLLKGDLATVLQLTVPAEAAGDND